MRQAVLVNGVPASGKSTVARGIAQHLHCPLLALDTVKEALFGQLGTGDRDYNRKLGRGSYAAIWALVAEFPADAVVVVDAWFGFQPVSVLRDHLRRADVAGVVELWCHAPPELVAQRYAERCLTRHIGHLGLEYVAELRELAVTALPTGLGALVDVDTSRLISWEPLVQAVGQALQANRPSAGLNHVDAAGCV